MNERIIIVEFLFGIGYFVHYNASPFHGNYMFRSKPSVLKPIIPFNYAVMIALCWAGLCVAGFFAVQGLANDEHKRDAEIWQRQMQLTLDATRRQVEEWVAKEQAQVDALANNTSLQLYLSTLQAAADAPPQESGAPSEQQAFMTFLSNLLTSEAQQHGFSEQNTAEDIPANVNMPKGAGLMILNRNHQPVIQTTGAVALDAWPAQVRDAFFQHNPSPIGPFQYADKQTPYMLFHAPIRGIQSDSAEGYIVGVKPYLPYLSAILKLPPQVVAPSESYMVRKKDGVIQFLTPLADGTEALSLQLDAKTQGLSAAYFTKHPGAFTLLKNYRGARVLAVGQPIKNTDWTLVHEVDADAAFADTYQRKHAMMIGYVLLVGLITSALIAVWRSVSATRTRQAALYYQQLSDATEKQRALQMHLTNTLVMLVDSRDPHAQHHSNGVAFIAAGIAAALDLPEGMQQTTSLAALLMNVGKIKTTESLLRQKQLSPEDKNIIRKSMLASAEMLKGISFDGPVVETLRQSLEHVDGSGPLGLKEDAILTPAKIIAVANAFVAMVSERAYRKAMPVAAALDEIRTQVDTKFSRPVVAALEHYLENAGGREAWQQAYGQLTRKAS